MYNFLMVHGLKDLGNWGKRQFKKGIQVLYTKGVKPTVELGFKALDFTPLGPTVDVLMDLGGEDLLLKAGKEANKFVERKLGLKKSNPDLSEYIEKLWQKTDVILDYVQRAQNGSLTPKEQEIRTFWTRNNLGLLNRCPHTFDLVIMGIDLQDTASIKTAIDYILTTLTAEKSLKSKEDINALSKYLWMLIVVYKRPDTLLNQIKLSDEAIAKLNNQGKKTSVVVGLGALAALTFLV